MKFEFPNASSGLSIVLPAYNEENNLETAVHNCLEIIPKITSLPFEIVVVNDGSHDRTRELLSAISAVNPLVRGVHHQHNKGYGQALLTGFTHTCYDLIFFTDADMQFDLQDLQPFITQIEKYDLVIGYRKNRQDPWHRLLFAYGWNKLMRIFFGLHVRDVDCAFKLFRRRVIAPLEINSKGAMFSAEFLIKASFNNVKYGEIGVNHYPRRAGKATGGQYWVIYRAMKELNRFLWTSYIPKRLSTSSLLSMLSESYNSISLYLKVRAKLGFGWLFQKKTLTD
ncbi:MAG: glycosyltransferase family 2 protein [Syntrophales bacterium]|nr:glycosyltransferase family 2 protein [Syntrophales bacterium]